MYSLDVLGSYGNIQNHQVSFKGSLPALPHMQSASLQMNLAIPSTSMHPKSFGRHGCLSNCVIKLHLSNLRRFQAYTSHAPARPTATGRPCNRRHRPKDGGLQRGPFPCGTTFLAVLATKAVRPEDPDSWSLRECVRGGQASCRVKNPCQGCAGWDFVLRSSGSRNTCRPSRTKDSDSGFLLPRARRRGICYRPRVQVHGIGRSYSGSPIADRYVFLQGKWNRNFFCCPLHLVS